MKITAIAAIAAFAALAACEKAPTPVNATEPEVTVPGGGVQDVGGVGSEQKEK